MVVGHLAKVEVSFVTQLKNEMHAALTQLLDSVQERLSCPTLPPYSDPPEVDLSRVLRAILLVHVPNLDLAAWNASIRHLPEENES